MRTAFGERRIGAARARVRHSMRRPHCTARASLITIIITTTIIIVIIRIGLIGLTAVIIILAAVVCAQQRL